MTARNVQNASNMGNLPCFVVLAMAKRRIPCLFNKAGVSRLANLNGPSSAAALVRVTKVTSVRPEDGGTIR